MSSSKSSPLLRLVLDYRGEELVVRCLYRSNGESNPGTKRRTKEIQALVTAGLQDVLAGLQAGRVDVVGSSGFTQREDVLSLKGSSSSAHEGE